MARYLTILLFCLPAFATNYTVKSAGGGNFTTISACMTQMSSNGSGVSDTCIVYAGAYVESPTMPAGSSGNLKILTVNGVDKVQITGKVTLNSYDQLVGNCPALQGTVTTLTCGFFITSTATGYISTPCVQVNGGSTFFYVIGNTMAFCQGLAVNRGTSPHTTHGFIQGNTISYPGTQASVCPPNAGACNVAVALPMSCDYCLVERNDVSHTADWDNEYDGVYNVFRRNSFHDNSQTECLTGTHGDQCHIDFVESEPGAASYPTEYTVVENNTEVNNIGSNGHGFLFQGDTCSGNCFDVILRFNQIAHVGGGGLLDDLGGFYNVHLYNNSWIDMTQNGLSGGITNHWKNASTGGSAVNELFYYPSAVSNFNAIACEDTSCTGFNHGHNIAFCGPFGGASTCASGSSGLLGFQYGTGAWLSDTGNLLVDPQITSYSSSGLGNLALQANSPARNAGVNLTTVNGTVASSTTLVVNDAHYFQDGHTITGVQGDCISVTTITNHVCITAVNYSTNTLTVTPAISATNGDKVWIYSISDGTVVQTDTGVDMGANPYTGGPPPYTVRTDLNAAEPGATLTSMGGCTGTNNAAHDDLGNGLRILRISDCNFNPAKLNKPILIGVGGSSDTNQFSQSYVRSGHTHYLLCPEDNGTGTYVTDLDYTAWSSARLYAGSFPSTGGLTLPDGGCDWAYTTFKAYTTPTTVIQSVDLTDWVSGGQSTPPSVVNVFDYLENTSGLPNFGSGKCLAPGFSGQTWNGDGAHSKDDKTFCEAFSWYPDWAGTTAYSKGTIVRPSTGNACNAIFYSGGGTSGGSAPTWPQGSPCNTTAGLTVTDGSITWTALAVGAGQGTGNVVACYRVGQGCTTLNTTTGAVSGDWGSTGTITQTDRTLIHNVKVSKDGNWLILQTTLCGLVNSLAPCNASASPEVWQIGTTNMPPLATSGQHGSGHWTEGYTHWINGSSFPNPPGFGGYTIRPFSNGSAFRDIYTAAQMPAATAPWDGHYGYSNADVNDSVPFVGSLFESTGASPVVPVYSMGQLSCSGTTTGTWVSGHLFASTWSGSIYIGGTVYTIAGTPTTNSLTLTTTCPSGTWVFSFAPITVAWPREIQAVNPSTGTTYRFSHTFVSGEDADVFNSAFAIGSVSQDGKLWAGTSDWLGTLGSTSGASTCTTTTNCRSDVFVWDLTAAALIQAATPTFSPAAGTYTAPLSVTPSCTSPGAIICTNTTGSPATNGVAACAPGSTLLTGSLTLNASATEYAVCGGTGYLDSNIASAAYTVNQQASAPVISPAGGTFATNSPPTVTMTATGPVICYTTDGTTPATNGTTGCTNGTKYTSGFSQNSSVTMKAISGGTGFTDGNVTTVVFTLVAPSGFSATINGTVTVSGTTAVQ